MDRTVQTLIFIATFVGMVVLADMRAYACSCNSQTSLADVRDSVAEADGAFVGTGLHTDRLTFTTVEVTFEVDRVVKGRFGPRAIVRSETHPCGAVSTDRQVGLLLGRTSDGAWTANLSQ